MASDIETTGMSENQVAVEVEIVALPQGQDREGVTKGDVS